MTNALLETVNEYLKSSDVLNGVVETEVPNLSIVRYTEPNGLTHAIYQPLICLVLQGTKRVAKSRRSFEFSAGESLLVSTDLPIVSQVTKASPAKPYIALVLHLDLSLLADLAVQMGPKPKETDESFCIQPTDTETAETALRLLRLLQRPGALPVLYESTSRELHYWLLTGTHGEAIRRLGWPDSHAQRVARAVQIIRSRFKETLPVNDLAATAGMSPSSFHNHFRKVTSLSPLQFQKQLRLIEARRIMTSEGSSASDAAYEVGYESVPQFTREYRRMFGLTPAKDRVELRA